MAHNLDNLNILELYFNHAYDRNKYVGFFDYLVSASWNNVIKDKFLYDTSRGWMYFDGIKWNEYNAKVGELCVSSKITEYIRNALREYLKDKTYLNHIEIFESSGISEKKILQYLNSFFTETKKINAIIKFVQDIEYSKINSNITIRFDADSEFLNTPAGVLNLNTKEIYKHSPNFYCTKVTAVSPSYDNKVLWDTFLNDIFDNDIESIQYIQKALGSTLLGAVKSEHILLAVGTGGSGKSTLFNTIAKVLSTSSTGYACDVPNDVLIENKHRNAEYAKATLRGARLALAKESDINDKISSSLLKQISSTDRITCEQKYKPLETFTPSHSLVLYTNVLPNADIFDSAVWDRLKIIEFKHKIRNTKKDIKNYSDVLFEQCGGYILQWLIDGYTMFKNNGYSIEVPKKFEDTVKNYKQECDWLQEFLIDDEIDLHFIPLKVVYEKYLDYCKRYNVKGSYGKKRFSLALDASGYNYSLHSRSKVKIYERICPKVDLGYSTDE